MHDSKKTESEATTEISWSSAATAEATNMAFSGSTGESNCICSETRLLVQVNGGPPELFRKTTMYDR